jgi:hypothetical protein
LYNLIDLQSILKYDTDNISQQQNILQQQSKD